MKLKKEFLGWFLMAFFIVFSTQIQAQNHIDKDSIRLAKKLRRLQRKEKRQNLKLTLDAFRFGIEGTYALQGLLADTISSFYANTRKLEGTADLTWFDNALCLMGGGGYWSALRLTNVPFNGYEYENNGIYFRAGLDYNILKHMKQNFSEDAIFLGLRFGQATGRHKIRTLVQNIPWNWYDLRDEDGDLTQFRFSNRISYGNYTANWLELVTGLRATVWRNFQMGYTFRYKVLMSVQNQHKKLTVNEIPGFGTTELTAKPSLSYHIFYRIPLRKKQKIEEIESPIKDMKNE